ncbi:DUF3800 domain-containing protein [Pseudomonas japonica]|uniref:DUF3800 domain-containing protein n=1 Tax=Pseudomonas japonica TaxID=256466 RepID=UPI0015E30DE1|nr:DUF3800 domain-containing protein [Pseudomonas japonica]MBA1245460.1 DUF3800 domain-containing protein [Pseudomonas japonica]
MTHYVAYLDEFGHVGQYVSRHHPKYKTHPAFGFAGLLLPATEIREFAIFFYKLKCRLLAHDLAHNNPKNLPAYQWEKKGSQLYTLRNVTQYEQLRRSTFRLLAHIGKIGGHVFYTGEHKTTDPEAHDSTETFKRQLLQSVRKIDRFCADNNSTFMLMLDEQQAGNEWRETNVEVCTLAMFEDASEKCRTLIEPPIQAESHLFQTIQCADWICGLIGRLTALSVAPEEYPELEPFDTYFADRIAKVAMPCSGLEHQKTAEIPAEQAGETMPDAAGALAGDQ